jgi:hypothetical protein
MNRNYIVHSAHGAFVAAVLVVAIGIGTLFAFEPRVGQAIGSSFTVSQTITAEISFLATTSATTMVGSIAGLTGGYATGTNLTVVSTNNATGYNMTLYFSSTTAMKLNGASSTVSNYTPTATTAPDFQWQDNTSGQSAEFGYTVRASTTSEVDPSFRNNGSTCNVGASETDDRCWQNPTTTANPETIINTSSSVVSSTTTIKFKVAVPSSPSPSLPTGIYVATGTLTAVTNP